MTLAYTPLMWLVPLLMGMAYAAHRLRDGRLSRPAGWKANRLLAAKMGEAHTDADDLTRAAVSQRLHDGLSRRVRKWLARAAQTVEALHEHDARVARLTREQADALQGIGEAMARQRSADENAPHFGYRTVGLLNTILFIGDITIVSMAIQANDSQATLFVATAGALALATALFVFGKVLGDTLKKAYSTTLGGTPKEADGSSRAGAVIVAAGIAAFSIGLYLLRLGHVEAWLVLATSPALGAAGVSLLGPSRLQSTIRRSEKAAAKIGKRHERALKKRGKIAGRVEYLLAQAHLALTRSGYGALSIGQMAGIPDAVTGYETVANQLGITLGPDFRHRPAATANPLSDAAGEEERGLPIDDVSHAPSNGEGSHEVGLGEASVFVPIHLDEITGEGS